MPLPHWITRTNRDHLNPVLLRTATGIGPMVTVHHVGRRSARPYETPVFAFPYRANEGVRVVVALTYGEEVDWLKNVQAAGSFDLERRGEHYVVDDLRRVSGEGGLTLLPGWVQRILRLAEVHEFLTGRVRRSASTG